MPKRIIQITESSIVIDLNEDPKIAEFLNHQKKGTRNTYTSIFRRIKENFTNETGAEILANALQWKRKLFTLRQWLIEQGYSEYYAQTATSMIGAFFDFHDVDFTVRRSVERN